jgi:hypothetical protein
MLPWISGDDQPQLRRKKWSPSGLCEHIMKFTQQEIHAGRSGRHRLITVTTVRENSSWKIHGCESNIEWY